MYLRATDAFTVDWSTIPGKPYANPPWSLVGRVLRISDARSKGTQADPDSSSVEGTIMVSPITSTENHF